MKNVRPTMLIMLFAAVPVAASAQVPGATDILASEIETVRQTLGPSIDQQIKIADIGDGNVAVGVLHRGALEDSGGQPSGLVHSEVSEVYYILSGGGTLVTGGSTNQVRQLPPESAAVQTLIGPSYFATSEGGRVREISEGDIVVIPAGLFHAWSEIPDHVTYLSIRPDPDRTLPAGYTHPSLGSN